MHEIRKAKRLRYRYVCLVKVDYKQDRWCRWKTSDLLKFTSFLDRKWPSWCFFNVFYYRDKASPAYRSQIANFTKNYRPSTSSVAGY